LAFLFTCQQAVEEQVDAAALHKNYPDATILTTLYGNVFGSPSCVRWACEHGLQDFFDTELLQSEAGAWADVHTLLAAQELGLQVTDSYMEAAAARGRLPVLQLLYDAQGHQLPPKVSAYAAAHAQMHVLSWLKQIGVTFDSELIKVAAQHGSVDVLQFLYDHGCAGDETTAAAAAAWGNLEALQFLRSHGCPWADDISCDAANGGSVPLMRWLLEQGVEVNTATVGIAARDGHLQLCQYLRAEGCAWDFHATIMACKFGRTAVVQWLIEHDCPYKERACCLHAAINGHIAVLAYLQSLGWLTSVDLLAEALNRAGAASQLAAAQWLRQQGAEWPTVLRCNGKSWSDELVAWARAEGCTSPTGAE
jgi:Ankyrin repeats (3 copies)